MEKIFKVGVVPGVIKEVVVNEVMTIGELFDEAGIDLYPGTTIRAAGDAVTVDQTTAGLADGTRILATKMIRGN